MTNFELHDVKHGNMPYISKHIKPNGISQNDSRLFVSRNMHFTLFSSRKYPITHNRRPLGVNIRVLSLDFTIVGQYWKEQQGRTSSSFAAFSERVVVSHKRISISLFWIAISKRPWRISWGFMAIPVGRHWKNSISEQSVSKIQHIFHMSNTFIVIRCLLWANTTTYLLLWVSVPITPILSKPNTRSACSLILCINLWRGMFPRNFNFLVMWS